MPIGASNAPCELAGPWRRREQRRSLLQLGQTTYEPRSMVELLPPDSWATFRGQPKEKGQNQTTHLADIIGAGGVTRECYVKLAPPGWLTPLTEAAGWLLARELSLPVPEYAAIVLVPLDRLRQAMPLDQHWLKYPMWPAFCCSTVSQPGTLRRWMWRTSHRPPKLFERPEVSGVSALDEWADNQDRHTGNLLVDHTGQCVVIDNEFMLYGPLWHGRVPFTVAKNSLLAQAQASLNAARCQRFKLEVARSANRHATALAACTPLIDSVVDRLIPDPAEAHALKTTVSAFLTGRSASGWLANQLGVIV
jgi:hypothetical protein